ncbi:MAG: hypothetical protein NC931_07225 [Candidatus Omnitrophica bacterium]|nr:hypothetical protein [Candidatus Omnitrophota bacterium]
MKRKILAVLIFSLVLTRLLHSSAGQNAPFRYVFAKAYHVLPGTHNNESGYFSLCEGLDGKIYIGTAKYNENSYLVEFDPYTERQKIVIDTHKVCGINATGYAAQAKIHTKNFVGKSGKIYVGSKQGYRSKGDTSEYPGGYVMVYDPSTQKPESLGMPYPGQGVIDVVADEERNLIYVVTCEDQHWMLYDMKTKKYKELGPILVPYATTLIDGKGRAHAITKDFKIATYDPSTDKVFVRPMIISGKIFKKPEGKGYAIPYWVLAQDKKSAYMTMMSFPDLYKIDLSSTGNAVKAKNLGTMIKGKNPDSRSSLCLHPDGNVYCLWMINNETGFGSGYLHHLVRYNVKKNKMEDLGVIAIENPDYFDFSAGIDGKPKPFTHGFHKLPDGTLTPLYVHQAMIATQDGTLYATVLYPFTLLRIDDFRLPEKNLKPADRNYAATQYCKAVLDACDRVESNLSEISKVAEIVAERHMKGGLIGFYPIVYQGLQDELWGRSGSMVNMGVHRPSKRNRTEEEKKLDVSIIGWQTKPVGKDEALRMKTFKERGGYIIGFGPKDLPELAEQVQLCDVWFDTGAGIDDRCVNLLDDSKAGRTNHLVNALNAWALAAEIFSAITRKGHTPAMWKSYVYKDGKEWGNQFLFKQQFMDQYPVKPIPPEELAKAFLDGIRYHVRKFQNTQFSNIQKAVDLIVRELKKGEKIPVASMGHMPWTYVGKYEDSKWAENFDLHTNVSAQVEKYMKNTKDNCLIVRLGYTGMDPDSKRIFAQKKQRVILISAENDSENQPGWEIPDGIDVYIDMGYAFGDACVWIEGLPVRILPPSGIMQIVAYECLNVEVLSRLLSQKK